MDDPAVRRAIAWESLSLFFDLYYFDDRTQNPAEFQYEMFSICEDESLPLAVVAGFRESGKTTIMAEAYALWAITGRQQKKFILILSQNVQKAQHILMNVRDKLERNKLLREDLGPFKQQPNEWNIDTIVIPRFDARIMIGSVGQSLRSFKHNQHRPDLIIVDDIEDIESVKTKEGRDKPWDWFLREVKPGGSDSTKCIVLGNMLHEDSFIKRLEQKISSDEMEGVYREYPFLDKYGKSLWPERFPDEASIERKRKYVGDKIVWATEYMLQLVDRDDQIFQREWFKTYKDLPATRNGYYVVSIDPAISQEARSDCTAIVAAYVCGQGEDLRVYILPNPINERLTALETLERAKQLSRSLNNAVIVVESVQYQASIVEQLKNANYHAVGVKVTANKHARLYGVSPLVQNGRVLFPETGAKDLMAQLVGFGVELHDDLADAFSMLLSYVIGEDHGPNAMPIRTQVYPGELNHLNSRAKAIEIAKREHNARFFQIGTRERDEPYDYVVGDISYLR